MYIGNDYICSCKSNYHTIMTTTTQADLKKLVTLYLYDEGDESLLYI